MLLLDAGHLLAVPLLERLPRLPVLPHQGLDLVGARLQERPLLDRVLAPQPLLLLLVAAPLLGQLQLQALLGAALGRRQLLLPAHLGQRQGGPEALVLLGRGPRTRP